MSQTISKTDTKTATNVIEVTDLKKYFDNDRTITDRLFRTQPTPVRAVDGVSFDIRSGETLGLVGESGCGKSTVGKTILRLEEATEGRVEYDGKNIFDMDPAQLKAYRRNAQLLFQDPFASINPRMSIGDVIAEPLRVHDIGTEAERDERVRELLEKVGLSSEYTDRYVHEFSGGQCQRIGIARALALNPEFMVLDEPVSALDVSVQAQILNLLTDLQAEFGFTYLFISHNLSVIKYVCDRIAVMYLGEIVEIAPVDEIFQHPAHPYTRALLDNISTADPDERTRHKKVLAGDVPSPRNPPSGCRFRTRCPEIIPPSQYDVQQETWRRLMDLRQEVENDAVDIEKIRRVIELQDSTVVSWDELNREQQIDHLKAYYELPKKTNEARVTEVMNTACGQICDGLYRDAKKLLSNVFISPCELESPELIELGTDQMGACHLHRDDDLVEEIYAEATSD